MSELRLGLIGLSDGNGHPYSWAAIFNGYNLDEMKECGFPAIPDYLAKQRFPEDSIHGAKVTHVWTQQLELSRKISRASRVQNVVSHSKDMLDEVDAILLARDDAENHLKLARPFIDRGLPIYIDKPLALSRFDAEAIFALEQYPGQIFSCSALRYANELMLSEQDRNALGDVIHVEGRVPKGWDKYMIHAIEPILNNIGSQGEIVQSNRLEYQGRTLVNLRWSSGVTCTLQALGESHTGIEIEFIGTHGRDKRKFCDSFSAFKCALQHFIDDSIINKISHKRSIIETIDVIETGVL